jgi:hypothetical protein
MPAFWDTMSPFYQRLPSPIPFAPDLTVDQVGLAAVAGVASLTAAHGAASYARQRILGATEHRASFRASTVARDAPTPTAATEVGEPEPGLAPDPNDFEPDLEPDLEPAAEATRVETLEPIEPTEPIEPVELESPQLVAPEPPEPDTGGAPPPAEPGDGGPSSTASSSTAERST